MTTKSRKSVNRFDTMLKELTPKVAGEKTAAYKAEIYEWFGKGVDTNDCAVRLIALAAACNELAARCNPEEFETLQMMSDGAARTEANPLDGLIKLFTAIGMPADEIAKLLAEVAADGGGPAVVKVENGKAEVVTSPKEELDAVDELLKKHG